MSNRNIKNGYKEKISQLPSQQPKLVPKQCNHCEEYNLLVEEEVLIFTGSCDRCSNEFVKADSIPGHLYKFSRNNIMVHTISPICLRELTFLESLFPQFLIIN